MAIPATLGVRARSVRLLVVIAMLAAFVAVPQSAMAAFITTSEVEPNGTPAEANLVVADASIAEAAISPAGDEDYFKYDLVAGTTYVIETGPSTTDLGTNYDIVMWLYDTDGVSQIAYDDDGGVYNYCYIEFTPSVSGTYYSMVRAYSHGWTTGLYGFRVREMGAPAGGTATISGVVSDMDGALEGIEVQDYAVDPWFYQLDSGYLTAGPMATTDADGMYEMTVDEGSHVVSFIDPAGEYYEQWFDGQPDMFLADAIELAADESNTMVDALLEKIPPIATKVISTERASVDADGVEGDRGSRTSDVSADGRYVVFYSGASLVPEDENGNRDWYRKDMSTGEIELVNVATDGTQADQDYSDVDGMAAISADGRYVTFDSEATNLVADDTNAAPDIFVRDMVDGVTVRVSVDSDGDEYAVGSWSPDISGDGRYVAFSTYASFAADDSGGYDDVYVHDMQTGDTNRVSVDSDGLEGTDSSYSPSLSHDGRYIAFVTPNIFVADDTNGEWDVYVKDMSDSSYRRANVANDGTEANNGTWASPSISADGSKIAFESYADNLVVDDMNGQVDIFVRDFMTLETIMVSVRSDGSQTWSNKWDADISANGRFVAFTEQDGGRMLDGPEGPSAGPAPMDVEVSLVPGDANGDADIILHDMLDGSTTMVSVSPMGTNANSDSEGAAVNGDGSVVSFDSWADNIVEDDQNEVRDVFAAHIEKAAMQPIDGPNRYQTAIQISQDGWADGSSEYVVIATGENWPDALGGSALAGAYGAPVLLTSKTELLPEVADEIERLGATEIYVLGGTRALSAGVSSALEALVGTDGMVTRLGGADRYETAEIVADEVVGTLGAGYDGTAFVATGLNFADALAASPLAAANGWPVYLAPHPTISEATVAAMQDAGVTDCILLGGDAAMPEGTNVILLAAGFDAVRIDGLDRYDTASKVASYGVTDAGLSWNDVAIATGQTFPDALAGGAAQGQRGSVMLLTNQASVPSYTSDTLMDNEASIANVRFFGGLNAISQTVRHQIHMLLN